jgi:hypothetical protein
MGADAATSAGASPAPAASPVQPHVPVTAAGAAPSAAVRNTSQAAFAIGVAKEVTKELFPLKTVLAALGLLALAWLIYRAVSRG